MIRSFPSCSSCLRRGGFKRRPEALYAAAGGKQGGAAARAITVTHISASTPRQKSADSIWHYTTRPDNQF
jgi:hypothetical protein